jgi:hypothetical protein
VARVRRRRQAPPLAERADRQRIHRRDRRQHRTTRIQKGRRNRGRPRLAFHDLAGLQPGLVDRTLRCALAFDAEAIGPAAPNACTTPLLRGLPALPTMIERYWQGQVLRRGIGVLAMDAAVRERVEEFDRGLKAAATPPGLEGTLVRGLHGSGRLSAAVNHGSLAPGNRRARVECSRRFELIGQNSPQKWDMYLMGGTRVPKMVGMWLEGNRILVTTIPAALTCASRPDRECRPQHRLDCLVA